MHKFLTFLSVAWQDNLAHRGEKLIWTIVNFFGYVPIISLWFTLGQSGAISIQQSTYLIAYYALVLFLSRITGSDAEEWLIDDIKDGTISRQIVRPIPFFLYPFSLDIVWRSTYFFYTFPLLIVLFILAPSPLLLFIPLLIPFIYLQRLCVSLMVAYSAFWIDQSQALTHLKWMGSSLLGGAMLPLTFYPNWIQTISSYTPFYFWAYFPSQLVLGKLSGTEIVFGLVTGLLWTLLLVLLTKIMWIRGLRQYSSVGG